MRDDAPMIRSRKKRGSNAIKKRVPSDDDDRRVSGIRVREEVSLYALSNPSYRFLLLLFLFLLLIRTIIALASIYRERKTQFESRHSFQ